MNLYNITLEYANDTEVTHEEVISVQASSLPDLAEWGAFVALSLPATFSVASECGEGYYNSTAVVFTKVKACSVALVG